MSFLGYLRPDGGAGIRNWVGVVSVMDNANPVTRAIVAQVWGTLAVTTLFVRGQYGEDLEITLRSIVGQGRNPNLAAVLVVGLERTSTELIAGRIAETGKPVATVVIQDAGGSIAATAEGVRKAALLVRDASRQRRQPLPAALLRIGVECGGSDTTSGLAANPALGRAADRVVAAGGQVVISETSEFLGAETVFAQRAVDAQVRTRFLGAVLDLERQAMAQGIDIRGVNPVPDNIRGGLTTIEEKALGAMVKAGTSPLVGVIDYGEAPNGAGLHFMATPAPAVESMTALAAGGCQLILFSTGVGNAIGNPLSPTVKVTGNVNTARGFADNIDVDVSAILERGAPVAEQGDALYAATLDVASGTRTTSEILAQVETAISRFGPTI